MIISERLRSLREAKNISQGEIEKRTGLKRSYISRVENGHTVPSLATLEKWAAALEISLYQLFYDGEEPPKPLPLPQNVRPGEDRWGTEGDSLRYFLRLRQLLGRISEPDRKLLLNLAFHMVRKKKT
jgi:transcriptional regulator with XRE-family HTH domain